MDEKISLDAISAYADSYSERVLKSFFQKREKITGSEILGFCNVQQVNLLIIKELFKTWKEENKKLRSPYFDYNQPEVQEALENLMNVLSRNISVSQSDFTPLVKKAVSQALLVIFGPYDFYSMLITGKENKVSINTLREEIKYLKVNKAPLERMVQKMESRNIAEISGNEALGILDEVLEEVNFTPEDVEVYIEKFTTVSALDPAKFFVAQNQEPAQKPVRIETPPPAVNTPKQQVTHAFTPTPAAAKTLQSACGSEDTTKRSSGTGTTSYNCRQFSETQKDKGITDHKSEIHVHQSAIPW
jgi:hypothetical protein